MLTTYDIVLAYVLGGLMVVGATTGVLYWTIRLAIRDERK